MNKCLECGKDVKGLGNHVYEQHGLTSKQYFDKYLRVGDNWKCQNSMCLNEAPWSKSLLKGYRKYCSKKCSAIVNMNKQERKDKQSKTMTYLNNEWWKDKDYQKEKSQMAKETFTKMWSPENYEETKNKIHTEEANKRKSVAATGRRRSEESKLKQSRTSSDGRRKGKNHHMFGKILPEEHKRKISTTVSTIVTKRIIEKPDSFGSGNYKSGYYFSKKNDCKIYYASSYELQAFEILELLDEVKYFNRCKFSIDYMNPKDSRTRRYIPDIEVVYISGRRQIIEIKPKSRLKEETVMAKAFAAQKYCDANDLTYTVWTENDLF